MPEDELPLPPPVPPRRKKYKGDSKCSSLLSSLTTDQSFTKIERKLRPAPPSLPPPAAPRRSKVGRKTPLSFFNENHSPTISIMRDSLEFSDKISQNSVPEQIKVDGKKPRKKTQKNSTKSYQNSVEPEDQETPPIVPFQKPSEPNTFPPLYFTFQDYQTVIECSSMESPLINEEVVVDNAKLNCKEISDICDFSENVVFRNAREEIYFQVTTTDRPFTDCLNWSELYNDSINKELKEKELNDLYIFEDYIDRSNRLNARPHLLFAKDFVSLPQDDNSLPIERSATKVRFLIESPSVSTPEDDEDNVNYRKSSLQLTDITNNKLQSVDENVSSLNEFNRENDSSNTVTDNNTLESLNASSAKGIEDSNSDLEENGEVITIATDVGEVLRTNENVEENVKDSESNENILEDDDWKEKSDDENERRKIFIDSSFYHLSNDDSEEWNTYLKREAKAVHSIIPEITESIDYRDDTIDDTNQSQTISEIQHDNAVYVENELEISSQNDNQTKIENEADSTSKNTKVLEKVSLIEVEEKLVPVSVSRNSFLENMLNEKEEEQGKNENNNSQSKSSVSCEVIAAHPKLDSEQSNEEAAPKMKLVEPGLRPKAQIDVSSENKSAGAVKYNMLNELLTNFDSIKLKPVGKSKTDDAPVIEQREDDEKSLYSSPKLSSGEVSPVNKSSAIVKEASYEQRNKDPDNKAESPVLAVSKDQPLEDLSIIPGSVKNFVKYYEIQGEICSLERIRDNVHKKRKNEAKVAKKQAANKSRNVEEPSTKTLIVAKQSCMKAPQSPKSERKKSVQFDSEHTIISPRKKEKLRNEEESTLSSFIGGIKTRLKRKAPAKPEVKKAEATNKRTNKLKEERHIESTAIVCIQKSPETRKMAHTAIPGNRSFLPQTETLQNSPTIVFYCTV